MTSTAKVILAHVQWKTNEDFFKFVIGALAECWISWENRSEIVKYWLFNIMVTTEKIELSFNKI